LDAGRLSGRHAAEADRLREIESRLTVLQRADAAGALGAATAQRAVLVEVEGLLAESKVLARDGHTAIFARIAIQAGWLIGRLNHAIDRAARDGRG
jgi:hypothetical protein